jgi:hypothetical protein
LITSQPADCATAENPGLLVEFMPKAATIGLLTNPKLPEAARAVSDAQEAARLLGRQLLVLSASASGEIDTAFSTFRQTARRRASCRR